MQEGALPTTLQMQPLRRISPSRYAALQACALREVLAASGNSPLLPKSPGAHIGTVIHSLLEKAAKHEFAGASHAQIESEWDALISIVEADLATNWVESVNIPLRRRVFRYAVRRIRAVKTAIRIATELGPPPPKAAASRTTGAEVWLEAGNGSMAGSIDRVVRSQQGITLRDYKSGHIFDDDRTVREEYTTQLKLYAALYHDAHGKWPHKLELCPPRGCSVAVPYSREECTDLLEEAPRLIAQLNSLIAAGEDSELAAPSPSACRFCQYRPACTAYKQARLAAATTEDWPNDLWGVLIRYELAGDGLPRIVIADEATSSRVTIRRLLTSSFRSPSIGEMRAGDEYAIFGLRRSRSEADLVGGVSTTILPVT